MLQIKKVNLEIISKYLYFQLVKGDGYFYFVSTTPEEIGTIGVSQCEDYEAKVKAFGMLDTTSVMTHKINDLTLEQWMEEAEKINQRVVEEMSFRIFHSTSKEHYEEYASITGGKAKDVLKEIVMTMIGGNIKALRKAYMEDKHLNNIDKVLREAKQLKTWGGVMTNYKKTAKHRKELVEDFENRCRKLGVPPHVSKYYLAGPYVTNWFLSFDLQAPEFISATKFNRMRLKDKNPKKSYGVSNSTICSGLKHVMIYDILECEFVEEKRNV